MPLLTGKSKKSFSKNVETEMHAGKPQKQALAIAYAMKRKAKKMAHGGMVDGHQSTCTEHCESPCMIHEQSNIDLSHESAAEKHDGPAMAEDDMVGHIMAKRMSKGGMVANEDHGHNDEALADFSANEFDDLALRDDLESSYTGANSGDEVSDVQEDADRHDIVAQIMKSRRKKDRLPSPA